MVHDHRIHTITFRPVGPILSDPSALLSAPLIDFSRGYNNNARRAAQLQTLSFICSRSIHRHVGGRIECSRICAWRWVRFEGAPATSLSVTLSQLTLLRILWASWLAIRPLWLSCKDSRYQHYGLR